MTFGSNNIRVIRDHCFLAQKSQISQNVKIGYFKKLVKKQNVQMALVKSLTVDQMVN